MTIGLMRCAVENFLQVLTSLDPGNSCKIIFCVVLDMLFTSHRLIGAHHNDLLSEMEEYQNYPKAQI